jgi:histidinol dehydrogenase
MQMEIKNRTYFRAAFYLEESESGIGIERYEPGKPVKITYIASVYFDRRLSNREAVRYIIEHVDQLQADGEEAMIRISKRFNLPNHERVHIRKVEDQKRLTEVYELASDALDRKSTITEEI